MRYISIVLCEVLGCSVLADVFDRWPDCSAHLSSLNVHKTVKNAEQNKDKAERSTPFSKKIVLEEMSRCPAIGETISAIINPLTHLHSSFFF